MPYHIIFLKMHDIVSLEVQYVAVKKKWFWIAVVAALAVVIAVLLCCLNQDFLAHYVKNYETDLEKLEPAEWQKIELDGREVHFVEGDFYNRKLWTTAYSWQPQYYVPRPVFGEYDAAAIATKIKNNLVDAEKYGVDEDLLGGIWHDTRYDVWCVWFVPTDHTENTLGFAFGVMFRGFNGEILYIGPC